MGRRGTTRVTVAAVAVALVATGPLGEVSPGVWAQTLDDLDDAERRVGHLEGAVDDVVARYEATWAHIELTRAELGDLARREQRLHRELGEAEAAVAERARSAFKHGSTATVETLLAAGGPQAAVERAGLLAALQRRERVRLEQVDAARERLDQARALIAERERELDGLQALLDEEAEALQDELRGAEEQASAIRSVVSRQRRIDRGPQQGIYACIFDAGAFRFRDTWGAPRSGGRSHRGTDVFAAHRAAVHAITSGVVQRHSHSRLGGIGLYLRGDDGNVYYYAHLDSIDAAGAVGRRVTAGETIARNGSTGNASRSAPHVHFELHPGGGGAINPYPWLAAACF